MNTENFWNRVKALIKAHKITQGKFSEYIGIPRSTFYDWMRFSTAPDIITAYRISTALGTNLEYLITGENGQNEKTRIEQTDSRKTTETEIKKLLVKLQEEVSIKTHT